MYRLRRRVLDRARICVWNLLGAGVDRGSSGLILNAGVVSGKCLVEIRCAAMSPVTVRDVGIGLVDRTSVDPPSVSKWFDKATGVMEPSPLIGGRQCGEWDMDSSSENLEPGMRNKMVGVQRKANGDRNSRRDSGGRL